MCIGEAGGSGRILTQSHRSDGGEEQLTDNQIKKEWVERQTTGSLMRYKHRVYSKDQ
jgi:hypothetical protein